MTTKAAFPDALINFDKLPDSANVRKPVVKGLYAIDSETTLHRAIKDGRVPAPKRFLDRIPVWNVGELRVALASLG